MNQCDGIWFDSLMCTKEYYLRYELHFILGYELQFDSKHIYLDNKFYYQYVEPIIECDDSYSACILYCLIMDTHH